MLLLLRMTTMTLLLLPYLMLVPAITICGGGAGWVASTHSTQTFRRFRRLRANILNRKVVCSFVVNTQESS
jgi:hypothetical protein